MKLLFLTIDLKFKKNTIKVHDRSYKTTYTLYLTGLVTDLRS